MKCLKCKTNLAKYEKICPNCGTKVNDTVKRVIIMVLVLAVSVSGVSIIRWQISQRDNSKETLKQDNSKLEEAIIDEASETAIILLNKDPFEDNKSLFELCEYEVVGGIRENEGKYNTYTYLPDNLTSVTIPDAFRHDGNWEPLTVEKQEERGGSDEYIMIKFGSLNSYGYGSLSNYGLNVGKEWDGESVFCYICHGEDADCLVIESINPTSSSVGTDTFYIGQDDGERTETIQIIELDDFSEVEYQLRYRQGGFTIGERETKTKENTPQLHWLYYQDGINCKYDYPESICESYDAAIEHIQGKLSKYHLGSRIGVSCKNIEDPDIVPIFIEYREGIRQDVLLDSIASLELKDNMYWGVNSQFSIEGSSSDVPETFEQNSILGVWDSADGENRLIFESTVSDFAVTYDGFENANGNVVIINFITGTKEYASYTVDGDYIIFVYDLNKYIREFLLDNNELIIDEKVFFKVDKALANRLIGTWENDELEIQFGKKNDVIFCDKTGNRSDIYGTYAVLSESEVWLNSDNEDITILNYSINGNMLDCNGTILYKNEVEKEKIVGTWTNNEDSFETYYVFKEDGYYECYATGQLYSLGVPTEEGTYEIVDVNKIRLYANDYRFAFIELEYSTDDVILNSTGKQYTKVE